MAAFALGALGGAAGWSVLNPPPSLEATAGPVADAPARCPAAVDTWMPLQRRDLIGTAEVVDGDTLRLGAARVRLAGIDAPERGHPQGRAASAFLRARLDGETVACQDQGADRWGRVVARCVVADGEDLGLALLAAGHAAAWPRYLDGMAHRGAYIDASLAAARAHCGLWRR